jgi:hypothetical protein
VQRSMGHVLVCRPAEVHGACPCLSACMPVNEHPASGTVWQACLSMSALLPARRGRPVCEAVVLTSPLPRRPGPRPRSPCAAARRKDETVWQAYLRRKREKAKQRRAQGRKGDSSSDDSDEAASDSAWLAGTAVFSGRGGGGDGGGMPAATVLGCMPAQICACCCTRAMVPTCGRVEARCGLKR